MSSILEIDSVIKSYDNRQILTDVYLKCQTGDIIGILGRNGSGKSTLLKILFGTLYADRKFIRIDGRIHDCPYKVKNELCYMPQHNFLPKHMTVSKVVGLYLGNASVSNFLDDDLLIDLAKSKISNLSGGEMRYLSIKLLLKTEAKFVMLDEPFNGVSPILVEVIKQLISESSKSKGIILTDHDYQNVLDVANRFCLIFDGGIVPFTDKQELVRWGYVSESKFVGK
ncbi:MAG: ATP-binding cassette domain-containing protein [Bacteroidales bacterium]|nr:ATP-binding cassette domain-containing protein [Bacteroidales bacterium]